MQPVVGWGQAEVLELVSTMREGRYVERGDRLLTPGRRRGYPVNHCDIFNMEDYSIRKNEDGLVREKAFKVPSVQSHPIASSLSSFIIF